MAQPQDNEAFRRFLRHVWRDHVTPLLRDQRAEQRKKAARVGGKFAAATGLFVDGLLGLKGKPFGRFMTVMGSSLGALLPDVWDWEWLRESAAPAEREVVQEQVCRAAAELPEADALALFDLDASATREELKHVWRDVLQRWHPDKAPDEQSRAEHHVRFLAYKTAYERLCRAYDEGRLPREPKP
ncbi:MAG TPA: J domain-containing protein [Phycisphaerae bacterium]|nr:J domain-containing protein [Phycisphaerae bacterium]HPM24833.1 J domain-containing protein [Phycisphaerae bacterium]